jgi:amino acid adenylation domain-containing protein
MSNKIHKALNVKLPLAEIFKAPTIRGLARYISQAKKTAEDIDRYASIKAVEEKEYYTLSSPQKRLYILQQMEPGLTVYNMPGVTPLLEEGEPDLPKIEETFCRLIRRHESLRTSFHMVGDEPVQRIHDHVPFSLEYPDLTWGEGNEIANTIIRPFDLSGAPLLRVCAINPGKNQHFLVVDIHHIISDGVSHEILKKDFTALYRGQDLPPLPIHYKDFSQWQNIEMQKDFLKTQEAYWLKEFAGEVPILHLPMDYPRPAIQNFEGDEVDFELGSKTTVGLKELALSRGATLYMVLISALYVLLSKLSGQEDIVVGTPVAGRRHADLEQIMGMFINTLTLRNYPAGEKSFREFLREVKERTLAAFENQEYQFEDLVEKTAVNRDAARNPLFDVMFVMQNMGETPAAANENVNPAGVEQSGEYGEYLSTGRTAKFDLTLFAYEAADKLHFSCQYCTKLFKKETIERFNRSFRNIISSISGGAGISKKLGEIEIISPEEKERILYDFNDTKTDFPGDKTIHELFEEQAARTPDAAAVTGKAQGDHVSITYKELNERANQLAHVLTTDTIVGMLIERSVEMIIGILGILKAGGGYLPIDPDYPQGRIDYMLKDSNAAVLLNDLELSDLCRGTACCAHPDSSAARSTQHAASLAYIIYTSGSTGKPKGVLVNHLSAVNVLLALQEAYPLQEPDAYLLKTTYTFDVSVAELFGWFPGGGRLAVLEPGGEKEPETLLTAIEKHHITHINFVPSMFRVLTEILSKENVGRLSSLRYIFLAGEALPPEPVKRFNRLNTGIQLENIYGPTEGTVYSSRYSLADWDDTGSIPIGKPLRNIRLYILDKVDHAVPVGVPGELVIGGIQVGRGYLNRPELTAMSYKSYRSYKTYISKRIYKTGDLARWMPDGNIEFLGRLDRQVKIRGFRIELGEIESRLLTQEGIKGAVVLAREDRGGNKYLCAYMVFDREYETSELREYLSGELPDYMIPSYFVFIENIPLTPSGKVDRKALPEPDTPGRSEYTAPCDEIERKLVQIWSEVLDIEEDFIGIDSRFFELGGHSLKAAVMLSRIHRLFNVRVPLANIFIMPTIRQLAQFIKNSEKDHFRIDDDDLVLLRSKSQPSRHLFCIHDGSGEVEGYVDFCRHLDADMNCWGIRAQVITGYAPRNLGIEEIAREYITKVKKVQPRGPYFIAGWSLGGTIAFEMVRQWEDMNENVDFLALIDSPAPRPEIASQINHFTAESEMNGLRDYLTSDTIREKIRGASSIDELWSLIVDSREEIPLNTEKIVASIPDIERFALPDIGKQDKKELIRIMNRIRTILQARERYVPGGIIHTPMHFFAASQSDKIDSRGWMDYCKTPIKFYEIQGDHFSIMERPVVSQLCRTIDKILNQEKE